MIEQLGFDMDWGEFYYWRVGGGGGESFHLMGANS